MMYQDQFKSLIEVMNKNTQLLIMQLLLKEKPNLKNNNNADSWNIPVINISHILLFESIEPFENIIVKVSKMSYEWKVFLNISLKALKCYLIQ